MYLAGTISENIAAKEMCLGAAHEVTEQPRLKKVRIQGTQMDVVGVHRRQREGLEYESAVTVAS
jgi:hypothetical protein